MKKINRTLNGEDRPQRLKREYRTQKLEPGISNLSVTPLKDLKAFYFVLVNLFYKLVKIIELNFRAKIFFHINPQYFRIDLFVKIKNIYLGDFLFSIDRWTKTYAHHPFETRVEGRKTSVLVVLIDD